MVWGPAKGAFPVQRATVAPRKRAGVSVALMEGDDGDLHVDDDLMESPEDEGGGQEHGQQETQYAHLLGGGGAPGGSDPPKQRRNRKPTGWYDAMRDLTEPGADGVVPPRPSDEALEAVNAAHGLGRVTLRQAREYVTEKRKTLARRGARQGAFCDWGS